MRGRKPTPTNLKILRGNPGKRPLNTSEPRYPDGSLEIPEELRELPHACAEWARVAPQLLTAGVYKMVDRTALILYCTSFQHYMDAERDIREKGAYISFKGAPKLNPAFRVVEKSFIQLRSFLSEFGMTPASRSKLSPNALDSNKLDEFDEYLQGRC